MPEIERHKRLRASDEDRDAVLTVLHDAYVAGRLDLADLTERQEQALASRYIDQLPGLVADVPEGRELDGRWGRVTRRRPKAPAAARGEGAGWTATILTGRRIDLERGVSVRNFTFMGGNDIYLRDALGPGVILTLDVPAIMGGHNLHVPRGVRVVEETQGVAGGNSIRRSAQGDGSNGTLVLRGMLVLGGHTVKLDKRDR
ncbi:MAG: DUF1707 domain-containing protein [Propionibacteriaceae bacterium]|nr:DUF1707 domain-containing protein [Propionibacteriaceae bacterium]